ncbi:MAG: response regulator [Symploca sp. SIO3C6]|uniref:Response regulator n=1 Tax=Symploca sp. SIO1C4 TaxID=2607765 RepID=A0A6B3N1I3_9CYAN|nr:response regulator [Symploca sp. SIO3C6]NER27536.1 response regulator [Symploca sp. SIO1C4]NET06205.1 response regulator [Symploca sp. SIO2B6]
MSRTILIIEDDDMVRSIMFNLLELEDFNVISAVDGLSGLLIAQKFQPDLIISEINVPQLDGYSILRNLRNDLSTANIPFICITPNSDAESRSQALRLGANDYLTKPVKFSTLLNVICNHLKAPQVAC